MSTVSDLKKMRNKMGAESSKGRLVRSGKETETVKLSPKQIEWLEDPRPYFHLYLMRRGEEIVMAGIKNSGGQ